MGDTVSSGPSSARPSLSIAGLCMDFGGLRAVDHLDLEVGRGSIAALIGPNGAGKTTVFNCVTGVYRPTSGAIVVRDRDKREEQLGARPPHEVTALGVARTFQNIRLFQAMTVLENVMMGRHRHLRAGIAGALFRPASVREEEERVLHDSWELLKRIGIARYVNEPAGALPYGAQRRLEIARALATEPFLLLLDEPAAGMNPNETGHLMDLIREIRTEFDLSILLIEHDMQLVMRLAEEIFVMDYGRLIARGNPKSVRSNPEVIRAYLGTELDGPVHA